LAADRSRWRSFVEALCSYTGDNRNDDDYDDDDDDDDER
jgi:hypothetical protein